MKKGGDGRANEPTDTQLSIIDDSDDTCSFFDETFCTRSKDYLTKDEEAVLADMRTVREKAQEIKARLKSLEGTATTETSESQDGIRSMDSLRQALIAELDSLRERWKKLDTLRKDARHRKMVMLGHEES